MSDYVIFYTITKIKSKKGTKPLKQKWYYSSSTGLGHEILCRDINLAKKIKKNSYEYYLLKNNEKYIELEVEI